MAVSEYSDLRTKIRKAIRDTHGLLFSDAAIDRIINEAQREYSFMSGSLVGSFQVTTGTGNTLSAPADFLYPVKFIGADGLQKPFYSWRHLKKLYPDFRTVTGNILQGIIIDFDGFRKFRVFPKLPSNTVAGTFYYCREAVADKIETTNVDAVTQYALFYVSLLDGKSAAGTYYQRFLEAVYGESWRERSIKTKSRIRRGRFF